MAAQESKVLEDLNSEFYCISTPEKTSKSNPQPLHHILPFSLRLQASRLQAIGFSDPRRGVSVLYDLGLECREHLSVTDLPDSERALWAQRLEELGVRVVNALIEIGDLDCAQRTLNSLSKPCDQTGVLRRGLLALRIGDVTAAKDILDTATEPGMLKPLLATAEDRYADAINDWKSLIDSKPQNPLTAVMRQNLAVNLLYAGQLQDARGLMEEILAAGESWASLTFNLATVYELSSDKARDLKVAVAKKVASQDSGRSRGQTRLNADYKL